ncbi:MAG: tRNA epoxyqueuosine(34) reductase QueG [Bacteroidota bacterium]
MSSQAANHSILIKQTARSLGFDFCGIAKAEYLEEEAPKLEAWLQKGMQGQMAYMANHFDKRLDPTLLVPGAKSIVSLGYNYFPNPSIPKDNTYHIARYAYGQDYHHVIKAKLRQLVELLTEQIGQIEGRAFVDSAPVMERQWAQKAGNGWIGKNSLLLNRQAGSYFFLAELIIDLELEPDGPIKDYCGTCTRCIDACPTDAIPMPYVVDGSRCISYLTIELKEAIPEEFADKMEDWVFGCDICQEVCPWNRFAKPHAEPAFEPHPELGELTYKDWEEITRETFQKIFKKSAVKRTKYEGLVRNISMAAKGKK